MLVRRGVVQDFACKAIQRRHAWLFFLKRRVFSERFLRSARPVAHENLTLFRCIFCPVVVSRCSVRPESDGCQNPPVILHVINNIAIFFENFLFLRIYSQLTRLFHPLTKIPLPRSLLDLLQKLILEPNVLHRALRAVKIWLLFLLHGRYQLG